MEFCKSDIFHTITLAIFVEDVYNMNINCELWQRWEQDMSISTQYEHIHSTGGIDNLLDMLYIGF